ncbi:restriction endonuclease [Bacillus sp. JJ1773]|uniref:restriction endonuclease n=1 Tax=Bacillus sp. JJ1773 TaxID=3122965 RepID=UPI0030000F0C
MTKKDKKNIEYVIKGIILIPGLWVIFESDFSWQYLLGLLFAVYIVPTIIVAMIPDKQTKKKKSNTINTSKQTTIRTTKSEVPTKEHNILRTDNEIFTLPFKKLTWREFERLCYLYYKAKGHEVQETKEGADGGVDLIYFDPIHNANVAVQIKQYSKPIDVNIIRNIDSAKKNHKCPLAEIITTSTYTQAAKDEAEARRIIWRDKNWVELFLLPWREKEAKKRKIS